MTGINFRNNKVNVQRYLFKSRFIEEFSNSTGIYTIIEEKNTGKPGLLQQVDIINIPKKQQQNIPDFWCINLEQKENIFTNPEGVKTPEVALLFFTCERLWVLLVELKNSLRPYAKGGIDDIQRKMKDAISRLAILFPIFNFVPNLEITFKSIIIYNQDNLSGHDANDPQLRSDPMFQVFSQREGSLFVRDKLGVEHGIELFFNQTETINTEQYTLDLEEMFYSDDEFENAIYTELNWPLN